MRPSPFYVEGGLPPLPMEQHDNSKTEASLDASRENPPYNQDMYNGFDPTSMYVGRFTNLDEIHQSTNRPEGSLNPADTNWSGVMATQQAVDSGVFINEQVGKVIYHRVVPGAGPAWPCSRFSGGGAPSAGQHAIRGRAD